MSQDEVGKMFYLMKKGFICGIFRIEQEGDEFVPWCQYDPFEKKRIMRMLTGDHARSVFNAVCEYFQLKKMAVQTMPETVSEGEYRDSMWVLFKEKYLPSELVAEIELKANKNSVTGLRLLKVQIDVFIEMYPFDGDLILVTQWEKWLKKWMVK